MAHKELSSTVLALLAECHADYNSPTAVRIRGNIAKRQQLELAREAAARFNQAQKRRRDSK